jgi:hypothetical protein
MPEFEAIDINTFVPEDDDLGDNFNPNADAFVGPPPPPDGLWLAKLKLNESQVKGGFKAGRDRNDNTIITAQVEARIVDEGGEFHDRPVFDQVSTLVMQGSQNSRMAGLLTKALEEVVDDRIGKGDLARRLRDALVAEPVVTIETQWRASKEDGEHPDGRKKYKNVAKGMKRFPRNEDGTYNHVIEQDGDSHEARADIINYYPREWKALKEAA